MVVFEVATATESAASERLPPLVSEKKVPELREFSAEEEEVEEVEEEEDAAERAVA